MPIARYTRFVAFSKRFLWLLIAVMVGAVVWIASRSAENGARIVFSGISQSENLQNIMAKPHYQGVDSHDRPFTIIADTATQMDKDNVALQKIRADMVMSNGVWVAVNSGTGILNMANKKLELHDAVDLFYDKGYEFRTDHAYVDIQQGSAYGDASIEGQGSLGTLKADSFSITAHGANIFFNGNVHMILYR